MDVIRHPVVGEHTGGVAIQSRAKSLEIRIVVAVVEDGFRVIPAQHGVMEAARQVKATASRDY